MDYGAVERLYPGEDAMKRVAFILVSLLLLGLAVSPVFAQIQEVRIHVDGMY